MMQNLEVSNAWTVFDPKLQCLREQMDTVNDYHDFEKLINLFSELMETHIARASSMKTVKYGEILKTKICDNIRRG